MLLPDQLENEAYADHWRTVNGYKILDNGAAEDGTITPDELVALALEHDVNEVVVPDVQGNAEVTMRFARMFKSMVGTLPEDLKFMGVVQGAIVSDIYRCVEFYLRLDWIHTVAFPRNMHTFGDDARFEAISYWVDDILAAGKEIHCLGSSQDLQEVIALASQAANLQIRGIDTCMPIDIARRGVNLSQAGADERYTGRSEGYFDWVPDEASNWLVVQNCNTYLEWARPEVDVPQ